MKKGFTLAEVLVTLAIIGVVAALTIPAVINNFQKQELYTRFIDTYNIFSNVYAQMRADGLIDYYIMDLDKTSQEILNRLRYDIKCDITDAKCYGKSTSTSAANNLTKTSHAFFYFFRGKTIYSLQNGANFQISKINIQSLITLETIFILVDTNGIDKGPNIVGRDLFKFYFFPFQSSPTIGDLSMYEVNTIPSGKIKLWTTSLYRSEEKLIDYYCNTTSNDAYNGYACGLKMLREHKMSY